MKTSYWGRSGNAAIDTVLIDPSPQLRDQEREADVAKRSEGDFESVCAKPESFLMVEQLPVFVLTRKKRFGQRTQGETTNTRTRATARIALTCLFGQQRRAGVRIFFTKNEAKIGLGSPATDGFVGGSIFGRPNCPSKALSSAPFCGRRLKATAPLLISEAVCHVVSRRCPKPTVTVTE